MYWKLTQHCAIIAVSRLEWIRPKGFCGSEEYAVSRLERIIPAGLRNPDRTGME